MHPPLIDDLLGIHCVSIKGSNFLRSHIRISCHDRAHIEVAAPLFVLAWSLVSGKLASIALVSYASLLLIVAWSGGSEALCVSSLIHYGLRRVTTFLVDCGAFSLEEVVMIVTSLVFVH